jgi:flagellar hook protein FlgE
MLDILAQAANAIEAYDIKLRAISSNISGMSVPGYKRLDVSFQEVFSKVLKREMPSEGGAEGGGTNPMQLGGTTSISNIGVDMAQGDLGEGGHLDLAVTGEGFFVISPDNGTSKLYTRSGGFRLDGNQNLVTDSGMQVYGYKRSGGTADTSQLVPINLSGQTYDSATVTWDTNGIMRASYTESEGIVTYGAELPFQIGLSRFTNPSGLQQVSGTAFSETEASGPPAATTIPGATVGTVTPRKLEASNVFYIGETIDAMEVQRAMSGELTVIKMVNDTISSFISKIS